MRGFEAGSVHTNFPVSSEAFERAEADSSLACKIALSPLQIACDCLLNYAIQTGISREKSLTFTGLLGGSFNPAHGGHRRITLFTMDALGLDQVWWLVSPGNPLKPKKGMASLPARIGSARVQARRAPIIPTAIEQQLGTRYTVDTLRALTRKYPKRNFVWLMGSDNLAQFHRWKDWRTIARTMPIAVIARPGYNADALASPAMAWLRRYRVPAASIRKRGQRSAPALVFLRFDPDPRSATAIRRDNADWAAQYDGAKARDRLTFRPIHQAEPA